MNKIIQEARKPFIDAKSKYRNDLFELYLQTAKDLIAEMTQLFDTGVDKEKSICSINIEGHDTYSYFFTQETIDDFKGFLNKILELETFPDNLKPFQEFLFEKSERYSLCSCYQKFSDLNDIEICYAEDVARCM